MSSSLTDRVKRLLVEEKQLLQDNFGEEPENIRWIDPTTTKAKVEVRMMSRSKKSQFTFRVYIPKDFPNSCPKLAVVIPNRLLRRDGTPLPEDSPEFHTLKFHEGFHTICHVHKNDWCRGFRLLQVFAKAWLWMEAYESYHDNGGESLKCHLLRSLQPTQETIDSKPGHSWAPMQLKRLAEEKKLLDEFYPDRITWGRNSRTSQTTVEVEIKTENDNIHKLRAYLPFDFPNSCPTLAIVSTNNELSQLDGQPLPENSQDFRTLDKIDGKMTICHCSQSDWRDSTPICKVFTKGEVWLKAYESYLEGKGDFLTCLNEHVQSSD